MRIPSGDLAPARKRRRSSSKLPVILGVVLVLAIAAVAYVLHRQDARTVRPAAAASPRPCASAAAQPAAKAHPAVRLPAPTAVRLRLLNGNGKDLLAKSVGDELARRGFHVTAMGNAPRPLAGPSRVYYGPGGRPAALLLSAHVLGSSVVPVPTAARGAIDVVLGAGFVRLRTAAEASSYAGELAAGRVPLVVSSAAKASARPRCS